MSGLTIQTNIGKVKEILEQLRSQNRQSKGARPRLREAPVDAQISEALRLLDEVLREASKDKI